MSTPEGPPGGASVPSGVPAELRGTVLDPAFLGRLANELFRAVPGGDVALPSAPPATGAGHPASALGAPGLDPLLGIAVPVAPASHPVSSPPSGLPRAGGLREATPTLPLAAAPLPASAAAPPSLRELDPFGTLGALGPLEAPPGAGALAGRAPTLAGPGRDGDMPYFMVDPGLDPGRLPAQPPTLGLPAPGPSAALSLTPELVPALALPRGRFDVHAVRQDFPILSERVHGKPLIWLDNAATTQKPRQVIERVAEFYERENSNIHRAAHTLAARATDAYESAREKVRRFLNAGSTKEIVFVRGTTEGMNLIAKSWGARHIGAGDEIVLTTLEHHSNIVPWQQLAKETGARLKVAPVDDTGQILLDEFERLFTPRTRLASFTQVSNALGTVLPVAQMAEIARRHGARVVIDGAQSVSHMPVDVQALGADFFVFSGHKVFGPTGIGVVYGRSEVLEETPPWQGGGNMIVDVTFEKTVYAPVPARLEAGTGNIADAVGLGAALDYVSEIGLPQIAAWEHELVEHATSLLRPIPGLTLVGTAKEKASVVGFVLAGYEPHEVGVALDRDGIAVRAGHHCAQPALRRFGHEATVRPSIAFYNTREEVEQLARSVAKLADTRGRRR